jgi:hypothetical protein
MRHRSRGGLLATLIILALPACAADDVTPPMRADLFVHKGPISVNETEIGTGEDESIALENQITLGPGASGLLTIRDLGRFELSRQAAIQLESWEPTEATAYLGGGHVTFTDDEESDTRLTLETSSSIIRALDPATVFTACQPPTENTCVVVKSGSIELTSEGLSQTYEARQGTFTEAAFIIKGEPPGPAICVLTQDFNAWFEEARLDPDAPALGELVGGYSECGVVPITVYVPGTVVWTDSDIDVVTGDHLKIEAGGGIQHSKNGPLLTPDGDPNLPGHPSNLAGVEDANHAGLIGKIGDDGVPFVVGSGIEMAVESEGRLYLGINDIGVDNNEGEFVAIVTLTSPPPS